MRDFCRTDDAIILDQEADLIIQQIDILFDTVPGEVIGSPGYGANFERFLYELNVGSYAAAEYIKNVIENNVDLMGWNVDVEVRFMVGTINDIMLVGVQFSKDNVSYSHVYKVTNIDDQNVID